MLGALVRFAVRRPWPVLVAALCFVGLALHALAGLPIEAFPDVTDPSVDVVATYAGQAAEEVERRVTLELERVLAGTPRVTNLRSVSTFGLALITLRFEENSDDRENRTQVAERLREATLPEGTEVLLGPQATPVGQIYRYTLHGPKPLRELRALQDFTVERQLRSVPGVADVVTFGGFERRFEVRIDPSRLASANVSASEVFRALEQANRNAGGGYVSIGAQEFVVRGVGAARSARDLGGALVAWHDGVPVRVADVAEVTEGSTPRRGAVSRGNDPEVVEGIVLLRRGQNPSLVLDALRERITTLNREVLPAGVRIVPFYDRSELIARTLHTVRGNLLHGAALVVLVLYLFLRTARGAVIVGVVIPFALLSSFVGLRLLGRSANLISLGAVDFGILVDGAVVVLEATLHALSHGTNDPLERVATASAGVARSVGYAMMIIIAGLAPVFLLERVEGRIFAPMAFTYVFALLGAMVAAFTVVPALEGLLLSRPGAVPRGEAPWLRALGHRYTAALGWLLRHRALALTLLLVMVLFGAGVARGVGTEFLPELDEGGLYITAVFPPDIALDETRAQVPALRERILAIPEVRDVLIHIGRPEQAAQAEGPNNVEIFAALTPRETRRAGRTRRDIEDELRARLRELPGVQYNFSQPITDRVYETISGIIGQVVVKVVGDDLGALTAHAEALRERIARVPGVTDLSLYQAGDAPQLVIDLDRDRLARNGLTVSDAEQVIDIALGGKVATVLWEGERRHDVALRLADSVRTDPEALGRLVVGEADRRVQLAEVAEVRFQRGRAAIWRENLRRFVALKFNVRGRDLGSVVADAQRVASAVRPPEGVVVRWGGEFENQRRAMRRLAWVVPPALVAILGILYTIFRRVRPMLAIASLLPVAVLGAVVGLRFAGENLSVSAAVGCVALLGQVSLAGILVASRIDDARLARALDPVCRGARDALRPVLLTTALAALGLVPAATSHAMGSETQRPFAVAIVAGLVTVLPMLLFILPLLLSERRSPPSALGARHALFALAIVLCGPAVGYAQPVVRTEAELFARWHRVGLEGPMQRAQIDAVRADVVSATTRPNPELAVGLSGLLAGVPPDGRFNVSAQVTLPLELGRLGAREREAQAGVEVRRAEIAMARWMRAGQIHRAVLALVYARARTAQSDAATRELERVRDVIVSRAAAGAATSYDLDRVRVELARLTSERRRNVAEAMEAEARIRALVADPTLESLQIDGTTVFRPSLDMGYEQVFTLAQRRRPDLARARAASRLGALSVARWEVEARPSPAVTLGGLVTAAQDSGSVLGGVSLPLPVFDRREGARARARAESLEAEAELRWAQERMTVELRDAWARATAASDTVTYYRSEGEALAESLVERAQRAYTAGALSIAEFLDAARALWEARAERLRLEAQRDDALADLADATASLPW